MDRAGGGDDFGGEQGAGNGQAGGPRASWLRPADLPAALGLLGSGRWTLLAGGTDLYPAHVGRAIPGPILDLGGLRELRGIAVDGVGGRQALRIGALTTWSDLVRASLPTAFEGLRMAAREVGGVQIQNQGTIGGNLCNASPAADGVTALLALDASVELASSGGTRTLPLAAFVLGNRRTALRSDELMTAVIVPARSSAARSLFLKLGHRRYLVISIAMAGVALDVGPDGRIDHCAVAVGACSAAALRLQALERRVCGLRATELAARCDALLADEVFAPLAPIDDVRGTAAYRRDAARELVSRGLRELAAGIAA